MTKRQHIGTLIRDHRKARGLTQTDLAIVLDVSQTLVSRWENGQLLPYNIKALREALLIPKEALAPFVTDFCDDVERDIANSALPDEDKNLLLALYGRLANRESVENVRAYRMSIAD